MKYSEISAKSVADLKADLKERKKELFILKMKQKTMQLTNTSELRSKKKEIAQIMTAIAAKGE